MSKEKKGVAIISTSDAAKFTIRISQNDLGVYGLSPQKERRAGKAPVGGRYVVGTCEGKGKEGGEVGYNLSQKKRPTGTRRQGKKKRKGETFDHQGKKKGGKRVSKEGRRAEKNARGSDPNLKGKASSMHCDRERKR